MSHIKSLLLSSFFCLAGAGCAGSTEKADEDGDGSDCDGSEELVGYPDEDGDGYGVSSGRITPCGSLPEGYVDNSSDCDDDKDQGGALSFPGADELCDGKDNDCDFAVDEDAIDASTYYADRDGDGYGNAEDTIESCNLPDGYNIWSGDCDDNEEDGELSNPGATEICDGKDNDCNDVIDDGADEDMSIWYPDEDGDGHGDYSNPIYSCTTPEGATGSPSDCDDSNPDVNMFATEVCDGIDNDCDELIDEAEECEEAETPEVD